MKLVCRQTLFTEETNFCIRFQMHACPSMCVFYLLVWSQLSTHRQRDMVEQQKTSFAIDDTHMQTHARLMHMAWMQSFQEVRCICYFCWVNGWILIVWRKNATKTYTVCVCTAFVLAKLKSKLVQMSPNINTISSNCKQSADFNFRSSSFCVRPFRQIDRFRFFNKQQQPYTHTHTKVLQKIDHNSAASVRLTGKCRH